MEEIEATSSKRESDPRSSRARRSCGRRGMTVRSLMSAKPDNRRDLDALHESLPIAGGMRVGRPVLAPQTATDMEILRQKLKADK